MYASALVRRLARRRHHVLVVLRRRYLREALAMLADVPGVRFKLVDSWQSLWQSSPESPSVLEALQRKGYQLVPLPSFRDVCPYVTLGLKSSLAWSGLRVRRRDVDAERALHERVQREVGGVFAVVHDDEERRIRPELLPAELPVVHVRDPRFRTGSVFDWITTIDKAVHLHGIDSCFLYMACALGLGARRHCHAYANQAGAVMTPYPGTVFIW
jgi:NAD(P)-dependent dehydrogenase (short-subunit alcohol dehydrogenase family)